MIGNTHALGIVSRGILGSSSIGMSSKGYLIQIEEFTYIPPIPKPSDGGGSPGSTRRGKKWNLPDDKKIVMITVMANGQEYKSRHVVNKTLKVSISDVEIKEEEDGILWVSIANIAQKS